MALPIKIHNEIVTYFIFKNKTVFCVSRFQIMFFGDALRNEIKIISNLVICIFLSFNNVLFYNVVSFKNSASLRCQAQVPSPFGLPTGCMQGKWFSVGRALFSERGAMRFLCITVLLLIRSM